MSEERELQSLEDFQKQATAVAEALRDAVYKHVNQHNTSTHASLAGAGEFVIRIMFEVLKTRPAYAKLHAKSLSEALKMAVDSYDEANKSN